MTTTTLTNNEIMMLFQQDVAEQLASQPLYYSASKDVRTIRRMLRENMKDINEAKQEMLRAHAEGHEAQVQGGGEIFVPEMEESTGGEQQPVFKSDDDGEKFMDKWNDMVSEEVEGFPVIPESELEKVEEDIQISGAVLDILEEVGLIQ